MDREEIVARLRENETALRRQGVAHAALFGSKARVKHVATVTLTSWSKSIPAAAVGVYEYVRIKEYVASLFDGRVDVVDREGLKPYVRPAATADVIYAF